MTEVATKADLAVTKADLRATTAALQAVIELATLRLTVRLGGDFDRGLRCDRTSALTVVSFLTP
jgi:hypothetical protein